MYVNGFGAPVADPGADLARRQRLAKQKRARKARRTAAVGADGKKASRTAGTAKPPRTAPTVTTQVVPATNYETVTDLLPAPESDRGWMLWAGAGAAALLGVILVARRRKGGRR